MAPTNPTKKTIRVKLASNFGLIFRFRIIVSQPPILFGSHPEEPFRRFPFPKPTPVPHPSENECRTKSENWPPPGKGLSITLFVAGNRKNRGRASCLTGFRGLYSSKKTPSTEPAT